MDIYSSLVSQQHPISQIDANRIEMSCQQLMHCENERTVPEIEDTNQLFKKQKLLTAHTSSETDATTFEDLEFVIKDSPAYYLGLFIDSNIISWLISEASTHNTQFKSIRPISEKEIRCFIAIIYLSGYIDVPRRRMLWERAPDAHCQLVSNAMQRDRFESIFTALYMGETLKDNQTKVSNLRPFVDMLNEKFLQHAPTDDQYSIAECVISTNRKNSNKRAQSRPLKVWCSCTKSGYCTWFDPLQLQNNVDKFNYLCNARTVIMNYARMLQNHRISNYRLQFESCYNDISLICELQRMGIEGSAVDRDKTGFSLNPALIGVDRMDCNINLYRSSVRGKKYYQVLMTYTFDVALHNAWQLYKLSGTDKKPLDLLGFRRNIVIYYLQHYGKPIISHKGGRPTKVQQKGKRPVPSDARFDGIRHFVIPQPKQTRCAKCTAKTTTRCQKCDVGLHVKCFLEYHQPPR